MTEKFCVKCGKKFMAIGRQVICPDCKATAEEDAKRAAVLRAKRASWTGESVPVRISGRASTVIRRYGAANNLPFAQALDALLQSSDYFEKLGVEWSTIVPYKSRRMKKSADGEQDVPQVTEDKHQDAPQEAQAAKASKPAKASRAKAGKAASKANKK